MTGTTDLATVAANLPAHLRAAQTSTHDEFAGGLSQGIPLAFLSIRGKEFRLRKDGQEFNTRQRDMSVVFIAARHSVSKRYYIKKYESGSLEAPDCSSRDGITPDVAEPMHPNCTHCPKNQWGSRVTDAGKDAKLCSDYKRVILWPTGLTEEPIVLDVAATSMKAPKGQKHAVLMLGDYLGQLAKHGMDPTQVVTKVSFTDAEYPQLCFTFERFVTEEEWARVQELRESDDVNVCIENALFEEGEKKEDNAPPGEGAKTEPAGKREVKPEPVKMPEEPAKDIIPEFPGKTTIMKKGDDMEIAEDEATWIELWDEGFRPKAARKPKNTFKEANDADAREDHAAKLAAEEAEKEAFRKTQEELAAPAAEPAKGDLLAEVAALLSGKK